jgi:hypothetical protein
LPHRCGALGVGSFFQQMSVLCFPIKNKNLKISAGVVQLAWHVDFHPLAVFRVFT